MCLGAKGASPAQAVMPAVTPPPPPPPPPSATAATVNMDRPESPFLAASKRKNPFRVDKTASPASAAGAFSGLNIPV